MNDIERAWKYGKIYREIYEVGQELKKTLDEKYPGHCITLTKKEKEEEDND